MAINFNKKGDIINCLFCDKEIIVDFFLEQDGRTEVYFADCINCKFLKDKHDKNQLTIQEDDYHVNYGLYYANQIDILFPGTNFHNNYDVGIIYRYNLNNIRMYFSMDNSYKSIIIDLDTLKNINFNRLDEFMKLFIFE